MRDKYRNLLEEVTDELQYLVDNKPMMDKEYKQFYIEHLEQLISEARLVLKE